MSTQQTNALREVSGSASTSQKTTSMRGNTSINLKNRKGQFRLCERALKEPDQFWNSNLWKDENKINLEQNGDELDQIMI